jgi:hypothetical protein
MATGGVVTLTLNNSTKRFLFPSQQLPSDGSITVVGVEDGTNISRVAWTSEAMVPGGPVRWIYRLE